MPPEMKRRERGRASVPIGSMWERGFRVSLPSALAVGSPSLSAAQAWANSCMVTAAMRQVTPIKRLRINM